ncbi:MAG: hypothetical protein EBU70_02330 [Actinobacteria bacterium]|nr:hypothetical protein [Actinomycetota bacterium]
MPAGARVSGGAASRLDDASRRIVGRAAQVAGALQDTLVEPRHLLVAMLLDGDPRLVGALARGGTTLDGLVEKFVGAERWRFAQRHALRRALTTLGPVPDGGNPALDGWSPHARKGSAGPAQRRRGRRLPHRTRHGLTGRTPA